MSRRITKGESIVVFCGGLIKVQGACGGIVAGASVEEGQYVGCLFRVSNELVAVTCGVNER